MGSSGGGRLRRRLTGPTPEDQQVGQRVAAEAVGAMQPGRHLAGSVEPGVVVRPDLGRDPDAAHHVVHRGPDLHRSGRDIDVRELLELLVHRGQLGAHALRPAGS